MAFPTANDVSEQLERLEQNITLTLQEIDHNFLSCHQIVTTRVLPHIEKYAEVSRDVCENAKLWLSFFESLDLYSTSVSDTSPESKKHSSLFKKSGTKSVKSENTESSAPSIPASLNYPSYSSSPQPPSFSHRLAFASSSDDHNHFFTPVPNSTPFNSEKIPRLFRRTFSRQIPSPESFQPSNSFGMSKQVINQSRSSKGTPYPRPPGSIVSIDSEYPDMSPPHTIQFSVPPSVLLKTPAKEAAKCIVSDVLSMMSPVPSTPSELQNRSILPESVGKFNVLDSDSDSDEKFRIFKIPSAVQVEANVSFDKKMTQIFENSSSQPQRSHMTPFKIDDLLDQDVENFGGSVFEKDDDDDDDEMAAEDTFIHITSQVASRKQ
ncbi:hypothetical protein G9A89_015416 [Geosiphon pyriformis]|nr:hypothetical protein G9A89_015416 [Geosiphon pyriformis]